MKCEFVENISIVSKVISAANIDEFKLQFKVLLMEAKSQKGIVYVWKTQLSIPRLKGVSPIVYIGKAKGSLYDRYRNIINNEADEYWTRYHHIISTYGNVFIEIYKTSHPKITENNFLYQYRQQFLELPPINLQSYKVNLLA